MTARAKPFLEHPGPPPLTTVMSSKADQGADGDRGRLTRNINVHVGARVEPNPRTDVREIFGFHPGTQGVSTRPRGHRPDRALRLRQTKAKHSTQQTRNPNDVKMKITTQKESAKPGRAVANPPSRHPERGPKRFGESPGRATTDPAIINFRQRELSKVSQVRV